MKQEIKQSRIAVTRQVVVRTLNTSLALPCPIESSAPLWPLADDILMTGTHATCTDGQASVSCGQEAINGAPEDQQPRVLISTSAVGARAHPKPSAVPAEDRAATHSLAEHSVPLAKGLCSMLVYGWCGCGAGYYGASESQTFSEASSSGQDYLAEVCKDWEAEAQRSKAKRNVVLRTGMPPAPV